MLRLLRVRHPASRHAVWTAVLVGMILLPFVSVFAPHWMVPVMLPPTREAAPQAIEFTEAGHLDIKPSVRANTSARVSEWPSAETLMIWAYMAGFFAMVTYRAVGWVLLRRVTSRSERVRARLRESNDVLAPVAVGVVHPIVILPAGWRDWSTNTKRAVLAHEYEHIRRHDTVVSALSGWIRCALWFHPLAWSVSRKVSELAELACDAAALERVGDPASYSRMLLGFADDVNRAGRRVTLPGLAMATGSGMDRRIDSVFELSGEHVRKLSRPIVLLVLVPVMCLAATLGLGERMPPLAAAAVPQPVQMAQAAPTVATPAVPAPKAPPIAFDAASIKPVANSGGGGGRSGPVGGSPIEFTPGRVTSYPEGVTARRLIMEAYHLTAYQLSGGPSWLGSDSFAFEAKAADPSANEKQLRQMLQTLLAERFRLVVSRGTREIPVYALVVAKGGAKLHEIKEDEATPTTGKELEALGVLPPARVGERLAGSMFDRETMDQFASILSDNPKFDRPVVDKTGLNGVYLLGLRWYADGDITTAMQEWLGLRLESQKAPMSILVIDHIERPSEN